MKQKLGIPFYKSYTTQEYENWHSNFLYGEGEQKA